MTATTSRMRWSDAFSTPAGKGVQDAIRAVDLGATGLTQYNQALCCWPVMLQLLCVTVTPSPCSVIHPPKLAVLSASASSKAVTQAIYTAERKSPSSSAAKSKIIAWLPLD